MKKYAILALTLVLSAVLLAGCRNRNNNADATSDPTILPTVEMPTMAPTEETTVPTTVPTVPTETYDNGNGPLPGDNNGAMGETDATGTTNDAENGNAAEGETTPAGRSRRTVPKRG